MSKHQEWVSLKDTGDRENDPLGGYYTIWEITGFGMGRLTGEFTYDVRGPSFPNNVNLDLAQSMAKDLPRGPCTDNVFDLTTLNDDEVHELRDRGVKIIIEQVPAVTVW